MLAAFLPLALAACGRPDTAAVRRVLTGAGFERITLATEPWWSGPCRWDEPYSARFTATRDGQRLSGVVCAEGADATPARLVGQKVVARAPAWNRFGAAR